MDLYWIPFLTGLTTGGLSCMAVQGGLVTGSLAKQIENDLIKKSSPKSVAAQPRFALPILLFLAARLAAYTILGFLLGWMGSVFSLSPVGRGLLLIAIAVFMLGNALRMLNVHPIFRYFTFEPPSALTRMLRRKSRDQGAFFTPLALGVLTVLIPCGVTQAMMAVAISSGDPVSGALTLFAFILGTSPVFFALTYLATRLSALWEKAFVRIVAIALLVLGLVSLNNGLNLVGAPLGLPQVPALGGSVESSQSVESLGGDQSGEIRLDVTNRGYSPKTLYAPADQTVQLHLVTQSTFGCARDFTIPSFNYQVLLPATGDKVVSIPPQKAGTRLHYTCSMGMYSGVILFQ
ncbi:MAG: sulfite exporter TauE/SafE family protein [Chloroflexota bacterium]